MSKLVSLLSIIYFLFLWTFCQECGVRGPNFGVSNLVLLRGALYDERGRLLLTKSYTKSHFLTGSTQPNPHLSDKREKNVGNTGLF